MAESKIKYMMNVTGVETGITGISAVKCGRIVTLANANTPAKTATAGTTLWTLPAELRPALQQDITDTFSKKRLAITTDGSINAIEALSNNVTRFSVTYISRQ